MPHGPQTEIQTQTLQYVTLLSALRPAWAHTLLLSFGLSTPGAAFALAANIAGATCLAVDPSPETCHHALRSASVDFAVNSLDEALRILKNEIRQGRPLSVALASDPFATLAEILDRGVLPQLLTDLSLGDGGKSGLLESATKLHRYGTLILDLNGSLKSAPGAIHATDILEGSLARQGLTLRTFDFPSSKDLRAFDAHLLGILSPSDSRHRWAVAASRHFLRPHPDHLTFRRTLYLTPSEADLLSSFAG